MTSSPRRRSAPSRPSTGRRRAPRRFAATALVAVVGLLLAGCGGTEEVVVRMTVTPGQSTGAAAPTDGSAAGSEGGSATPSATDGGVGASSSGSAAPGAGLRITASPAFGSKDVGPNEPITVTVFAGQITALTVEGDDGTPVAGKLSEDKTTFTVTDRLDYGRTYTFTGTATGSDGSTTPITGKLSTVNPSSTVRASVQIPDGNTVGVGAPIVVTFCPAIQDKAAAEKAMTVTTDKKNIVGGWGWLADEDFSGTGVCSQAHYRPQNYWPANTTVTLKAALKGVDYGNGWGREDLTRTIKIGRSLIMKAEVDTKHLVVIKDGLIWRNYAVSYGKESVPGRTTVSGPHIVQEKYPTFKMCNPKFGYCNLLEKWAIRINNNGEFIHENEKVEKAGLLGKENVSHGCINMGGADAKELYDTVIYGDVVEVTGTSQQMSEQDYVYDWKYSWPEWQALSALG